MKKNIYWLVATAVLVGGLAYFINDFAKTKLKE